MVKEQLIVSGIEIPLNGSLNPNLTYSIQDITKPDKRKATFSKSITLPGSKILNDLFGFIFEVNIDGTFNPNISASAKYLVDSQTILDGIIQLKEIELTDNEDIIYKVVLLGSIANVFNELGELELEDIQNLDDFNHQYNPTQQALTWATSYPFQGGTNPFAFGEGIIYPIVNYGMDNSLDSYSYYELYPAFFAKELFDRIFSDAGYTYNSNFLSTNNAFIKGIIPFNGLKFGQTAAVIANKKFTANTPVFSSSMIGKTGGASSYISFTDVSDPGGVHSGGVFTSPASGDYSFKNDLTLNVKFNPYNTTNTKKSNFYLKIEVVMLRQLTRYTSNSFYVSDDGFTYPATGGTYTTGATPTYPNSEYLEPLGSSSYQDRNFNPPNKVHTNCISMPLFTGRINQMQVIVTEVSKNTPGIPSTVKYYDTFGAGQYSEGTWDIFITDGSFSNDAVNTEYQFDDVVDMNSAVPQGIKQRDYVMSIINMFNLFVEQDTNNPNQYNIEPRDDFYNTNVNDWSKKLDVSKPLVMKPMGLLDAGKYTFTYKSDKDYYNKLYSDTYIDKIYGQREVVVDNDFLSNDNKQEIIFSPTPLVGQSSNDRVVSTIIKVDKDNQAQRTDSNIRYLIYDGLKPTSSLWLHETWETEYPYCGHLDDPFNPTFDVNFGLPHEIYYDDTFYPINLTDANLYNVYHRKQLEEVTDKDSKVVQGMFNLSVGDVANISFSEQYYFNRAYHRLLKIINYNPNNGNLTECHFLKLKTKGTYTPITTVVDGAKNTKIGTGDGSKELVPVKNLYQTKLASGNIYDAKLGTVSGEDNFVAQSVKNFSIVGDENKIGDGSQNITISGDNNIIASGVFDVTLINTDSVTVTESDVTYVNGRLAPGSAGSIVQTSSFIVGVFISKLGYEADTTSNDVNFRLPTAVGYEGIEISFKKVSNDSNVVTIAPPGTETVDNEDIIYIPTYNDLIVLYSNGTNWKIK